MFRRKSILMLLLVLVIAGAAYAGLAIAADTGEPGSHLDPLVTKSFVEQYVADFAKKALDTAGNSGAQWRTKAVAQGENIVFTGGTEFIIRSGKAVIVDPVGNGIPDLTAGTSAASGQTVARDHLFLVPRSDGRGIHAQSAVTVMYIGSLSY
jgi:hypothetical protein